MVDWEWGKDGEDLPTVLLEMSQEFLRTGWPWSSFPIGIHSLSPVPTMPFHSLIMTPLRARSHLSHALAAHRIFILNIFFFKWIFLFQHHSQGTFIILNLIPTPEKPHPAWPCRRETSRRWKFWCPEWFGWVASSLSLLSPIKPTAFPSGILVHKFHGWTRGGKGGPEFPGSKPLFPSFPLGNLGNRVGPGHRWETRSCPREAPWEWAMSSLGW